MSSRGQGLQQIKIGRVFDECGLITRLNEQSGASGAKRHSGDVRTIEEMETDCSQE